MNSHKLQKPQHNAVIVLIFVISMFGVVALTGISREFSGLISLQLSQTGVSVLIDSRPSTSSPIGPHHSPIPSQATSLSHPTNRNPTRRRWEISVDEHDGLKRPSPSLLQL